MKEELSALELHFILKEIDLDGGKVDRIYQIDNKNFLFQFHKTGVGKVLLRFQVGRFFYRTNYKAEMPQNPPGYCMYLRKYVGSARIDKIEQVNFERIIKITLRTKEKIFNLYIELFGKGNVILCDENDIILSPLQRQEWADRSVKKGEVYVYPKQVYNVLTLTNEQFAELLKNTKQESLVKMLAVDLGLGGTYAEEVCLRAKIDKKIEKLTIEQQQTVFEKITKLLKENIKPLILKEKDMVIDIVPFPLQKYEGIPSEEKEFFNEALDSVITIKESKKVSNKKQGAKDKKVGKLQTIVIAQSKQTKKLEEEIQKNQRIGELIYEHYQEVDTLLKGVSELRKTKSWDEIKQQLKKIPLVKDVKEKEKCIVISLD